MSSNLKNALAAARNELEKAKKAQSSSRVRAAYDRIAKLEEELENTNEPMLNLAPADPVAPVQYQLSNIERAIVENNGKRFKPTPENEAAMADFKRIQNDPQLANTYIEQAKVKAASRPASPLKPVPNGQNNRIRYEGFLDKKSPSRLRMFNPWDNRLFIFKNKYLEYYEVDKKGVRTFIDKFNLRTLQRKPSIDKKIIKFTVLHNKKDTNDPKYKESETEIREVELKAPSEDDAKELFGLITEVFEEKGALDGAGRRKTRHHKQRKTRRNRKQRKTRRNHKQRQ